MLETPANARVFCDPPVGCGQAALKTANYLKADCGPKGYKELLRFASSFVCKATGEEVAADIVYYDDQDRPWAPNPSPGATVDGQSVSKLSTNPNSPTPYFTGTGVNYLGTGGVCDVSNPNAITYRTRYRISACPKPKTTLPRAPLSGLISSQLAR